MRVRTGRTFAWQVGLLALATVVVAALSACGGSESTTTAATASAAPDGTATQTSEGGSVTVKVTWRGREAGPVFTVAMDTHSVDLDGLDLTQLAVLRLGSGQEARPVSWDAPNGGHHRQGTLTFPSTTEDGSRLIDTGTHTIELVIRDVAGVPERTFRWTL